MLRSLSYISFNDYVDEHDDESGDDRPEIKIASLQQYSFQLRRSATWAYSQVSPHLRMNSLSKLTLMIGLCPLQSALAWTLFFGPGGLQIYNIDADK
ncbi:hypothetical protein CVT25_001147 [Psilocybe cyanescens]|uniref:Uncharacterized protein n=1 Tax=Psilocybe cyanescens TaxID=93625 RepID=A0A409XB08_PSICY|nr:hypothetical protein CVT25_001147 [Psilocybe cyanescens]